MTDKEFLELVAKMRDAQTKWFSTKIQFYLYDAKRLEKEVDAAIKKLQTKGFSKEQSKLF